MTTDTIKTVIAPCGLCCETCFAHVDGDIRKLSIRLKEKLGDFQVSASRFESMLEEPVFKNIPSLKKCSIILRQNTAMAAEMNSAGFSKTAVYGPVTRKWGLIFVTSVMSSPAVTPGLMKIFTTVGW